MNSSNRFRHFGRALAVAVTTAVVVTAGVTAANAEPATSSAGSEVEAVEVIEQITGTEALVEVVPGETSEHVTVPETADEPVVLEADGVRVAFEQPGTSDAKAAVGDNGTVSYVDEGASFNTHVQVLESPDSTVLSEGVRSLIEIQDASAPTEYVYSVTLDEGTVLQVAPDGSVEGTHGDRLVLIVPAPWALDADGVAVPTWYEVRGVALVQHVAFKNAHAFPVIADPVWFVPVLVAGAGVIARVAVTAATRAAAVQSTITALRQQILSFSANRWSHIMDPKHNWSRLANSRTEIASLMSQTVAHGTRNSSSKHFDYVWTHRGQTIVVRTSREGHISNGWIR